MAEFSSLTWPPHSHGLGLGLQSGGESWRNGEPALGYRGSQSATQCGTHDPVAPACCLTLEKGLRGAKTGGSSDPPEGVSHEEKGQLHVSSQHLERGCEARAGLQLWAGLGKGHWVPACHKGSVAAVLASVGHGQHCFWAGG